VATKLTKETKVELSQFIEYLTERLIPDLRESGKEATADDFAQCVSYMQMMRKALRGAENEVVDVKADLAILVTQVAKLIVKHGNE
jgi:hypothetical protein